MARKEILRQLEELLARFEIKVVYENLSAQAIKRKRGLCRHENDYLLIINKNEKTTFKINAICEVLADFNLETIYLAPQLRQIINQRQPNKQKKGPPKGDPCGCS